MKPSTALGIILDLVSNAQRLSAITTPMCMWATLTINLHKVSGVCEREQARLTTAGREWITPSVEEQHPRNRTKYTKENYMGREVGP